MFGVRRETIALAVTGLLFFSSLPLSAQNFDPSADTTIDKTPEESLSDYFNRNGYEALQRFTAAPARFDGKPAGNVLGMSVACENGLTPKCARYALANKETVADSIADHPEYWASFAAYLETSPAVTKIDIDTGPDLKDKTIDRSRIFDALNNWPIAQLLETRKIDGVTAARQLTQLRRWQTEKTVLLDRMFAIAALGIQIPAVNAALAIAAQRRDKKAIDALTTAMAPLTIDEMSLATAFAGEIAYASFLRDFDQNKLSQQTPLAMYEEALKQHEFMRETYGQDYPEPQMLTQLEFDELQREVMKQWQLSQSHWQLQMALSDATHDNFWGDSAEWEALVAAPETIAQWAYVDYSYNARLLGLHIQVLRALRDHYVEGQPIAYPTEPAPKHFAWEWRENSDELCLVPVTVNRHLANKVEPACLPVWPAGE